MLIATAIMTVGLVMIATIFPVGVRLTGLSAERSVAAVVADEAFAKIQLYGLRDFADWPAALLNPTNPVAAETMCSPYRYTAGYAGPDGVYWTGDDNDVSPGLDGSWGTTDDIYWDAAELVYPSSVDHIDQEKRYYWSALCRRVDIKDVQVTVFVTSKTFAGMSYHAFQHNGTDYVPSQTGPWPSPVRVSISFDTAAGKEKILYLADDAYYTAAEAQAFFGEGYTIVDDYTGKIYRVLEVNSIGGVTEIMLYDEWEPNFGNPTGGAVWVVPPGVGSDRYPCVGVFQRVIRFDAIQ